MELKEYWDSLSKAERKSLAERCDTTEGHLRNVVYGSKTCGESLSIALDRESRGVVPCETTRPDVDWAHLRGSSQLQTNVSP